MRRLRRHAFPKGRGSPRHFYLGESRNAADGGNSSVENYRRATSSELGDSEIAAFLPLKLNLSRNFHPTFDLNIPFDVHFGATDISNLFPIVFNLAKLKFLSYATPELSNVCVCVCKHVEIETLHDASKGRKKLLVASKKGERERERPLGIHVKL